MEFEWLGELLAWFTKDNIILVLGCLCVIMFFWNLHISNLYKNNTLEVQKASIKFLSLEEKIQRIHARNNNDGPVA